MYSLKKLTRLHWALTVIKKIQSIESIETYAYEISEHIIHKNEKMKDKNITKWF